jgi:hypothetical protein
MAKSQEFFLVPCWRNIDNNCIENCPAFQEMKDAIVSRAQEKGISPEECVKQLRAYRRFEKMRFSETVRQQLGWTDEQCRKSNLA